MDIGLIIPGFVFTEIGPEQMMQFGMAADEFVDRLIPQMKAGEFYIVSHPYNAVRITEAYEEVKQAFDTYAPRFDGDEAYDVQLLMEGFKKQREDWTIFVEVNVLNDESFALSAPYSFELESL